MRRFAQFAFVIAVGFVSSVSALAAQSDATYLSHLNWTDSISIRAMTGTSDGGYLIAGIFGGTVDLDPGPGTNSQSAPAGENRFFVSRFSAAGAYQWSVTAVGASGGFPVSYNHINAIVEDADFGIALVGRFTNTMEFDTGSGTQTLTVASAFDSFVWRMKSDGDFVWAKEFVSFSLNELHDVLMTGSGAVILVGELGGNMDLDPGPGSDVEFATWPTPCLISLDASGDYLFGHLFAGGSGCGGAALGVGEDAAGRLYIAGNYYTAGIVDRTLDFDPGAGDTASDTNDNTYGFLAKYDASGNFLNLYNLAGSDEADVRGLSVDADGNTVLVGEFTETVDFDPTVATEDRTSAGGSDSFVLAVTGDDKYDWVHTFGGTGDDAAGRVRRGPLGEILVLGGFRDTVDFSVDPPAVNVNAPLDPSFYLLRLASNGAFGYVKSIAASASLAQAGYPGMVYTPSRRIFWAGYSGSGVDVDPGAGSQVLLTNNNKFIVTLQESVSPRVLSITRQGGSPTGTALIDFKVTFDQPVNDVDESDFALTTTGGISGAYVYSVSGSLNAPIATVNTGTGSGTIRLDLLDDDTIIEPTLGFSLGGAGVGNGSFTNGEVYSIDKTLPSAALSSAAAAAVNAPISVSVQLSVNATDFAAVDIDPINATVSDFAGAGDAYTFVLNPIAEGTFGAAVGALGFTDGIGNFNTASNLIERNYDVTAPEIEGVVAAPDEARVDDEVALSVTVSEALESAPTVTVNGAAATYVPGAKAAEVYDYTYVISEFDPVGPASIEVLAVDLAGNSGTGLVEDALVVLGPEVAALPGPGALSLCVGMAIMGVGVLLRRRGR